MGWAERCRCGGSFIALVGLIYVGAVLFINGLVPLGLIEQRFAAVFNLFGCTYFYVGITLPSSTPPVPATSRCPSR